MVQLTAWPDAARDAVEALIHSLTNPTISPASIIDEVKAARGSLGTLDGRLDVSLNEDGTLKSQASLVTQSQARTIPGTINCVPNSDFLLWSMGDAAAPDYFTLTGAGAAIARTGTGLGDTQRGKYGLYAAKITYGSAAARLSNNLIPSGDFAAQDGIKSRKVSAACWGKTSIVNHASIVIDDGVTQTRGGSAGSGGYHSGGGTLEWLYCTHTVSTSGTKLTVYVEVASAGAAYFADIMVVVSDIPPADFSPCPMVKRTYQFHIAGNVATGSDQGRFLPEVSGIIQEVALLIKTAPPGQALIVDVNTWDGAAYTTAFTTKPQLSAGSTIGGSTPDATYARRCFNPFYSGASLSAGQIINFDVDQVGSGVAGADLDIFVRIKQYIRPLEAMLIYND